MRNIKFLFSMVILKIYFDKIHMLMTSTSGIQTLNVCGILVQKPQLSLNITTIKLYVSGSKIKQKF